MLKKVRRILVMLICIVFMTGLVSCSNNSSSSEKVAIVDLAGDRVELPTNIDRVVSTSEPGTNIMVMLGQKEKLVGVYYRTLNNPWFEEFYGDTSNITSFDNYTPEAESLIAIDTDIIFVPSQERAVALREKGICAITIRFYTPNEVKKSVQLLGEIFGGEALIKAEQWLNYFESTIDEIGKKIKDVKEEDKPVVYEILADKGRGPFRTYYGENQAWLSYAGGILATKDYGDSTSSTMPTEEAILATNPDVIFIGGVYARKEYEDLLVNEKWSSISAVVNNEIYIEPVGCLAWNACSAEYPLLIKFCFSYLYPEKVDFNLKEDTQDFYKTFYGINFEMSDIDLMFSSLSPDGGELWI